MRNKLKYWPLGLLTIVLLAPGLTGCGSSSKSRSPGPVVALDQGTFRGMRQGDVHAFLGIPYAMPPTGERRFAPPEPPLSHGGIRLATSFGSSCPQVDTPFGSASLDEDCLFLNVYRPAASSNDPYPVMVWFHGGAFIYGSGADPDYVPAQLVARDVVLVTINYRLGALGFLPHAALTAESPDSSSGNYGLMDQQLALAWIADNIHHFGGDPGNVTIFGESAGGHSVLTHLAMPSSQGLFHKAILQSGIYHPEQVPLAFGELLLGAPFSAAADCDTAPDIAGCLRALSVSDVLTAQGASFFLPMSGTDLLPVSALEALMLGDINAVPVLAGSNLDEGTLFVALDMFGGSLYMDEAEYEAGVANLLVVDYRDLDTDQIAADYLAAEDAMDPNRFRSALAKIQTDWRFNCNQLLFWGQVASEAPVYAYWFVDQAAPHPFDSPLLPTGATHTAEIPYVFGTLDPEVASAEQLALGELMADFWTSFAHSGAPISDDLVLWEQYSPDSFVMALDTPIAASDAGAFSTAHSCVYWANPPLL